MPNYESITLREDLHIRKIYSIHYFEYMKDYVFDGESHDFWEFVFVDSGNLFVTAGDKEVLLASNEMIFHKPNEFHALRGDGETSPNLVVVSFECTNPCMKFFENCRVSLNQNERFYLGQIISETRKTFYTPLNNPNICLLERNSVHDFGSEQIIFLSLELLLISLQRRYSTPPAIDPVSSPPFSDHPMIRKDTDEVFQEIVQYLQRNLSEHLTVVQICKENSVGRSQLQKIFHEKTGCGVIDYFCRLKIETAQKMIRQKRYNYTQISDMLGYSSYQYFSLQFKKFFTDDPIRVCIIRKEFFRHRIATRACLKKAFRELRVPVYGRFYPNEGGVAGYGNRMRVKSPAKWGLQIAEMIFQTRSKAPTYTTRLLSSIIRVGNK